MLSHSRTQGNLRQDSAGPERHFESLYTQSLRASTRVANRAPCSVALACTGTPGTAEPWLIVSLRGKISVPGHRLRTRNRESP